MLGAAKSPAAADRQLTIQRPGCVFPCFESCAGRGIAELRPAAGRPARAQGRLDAVERPADAILLAAWRMPGEFPAAEPQRAAPGLPLLPG